jgi:endonuclease YncB( thermonuclease family)
MNLAHYNLLKPMPLSFKLYLIFPAILVMAFSFQASADTLAGKVVGILDGDTIDLLAEGNIQTRIRLKNIDAPEKAHPLGR